MNVNEILGKKTGGKIHFIAKLDDERLFIYLEGRVCEP